MIVVLVDSCRDVWFKRKDLLRPPSRPRKEEEKKYREDGSRQLRKCHNKPTIKGRARFADSTMTFYVLQPRTTSLMKNRLQILAPIAKIFL